MDLKQQTDSEDLFAGLLEEALDEEGSVWESNRRTVAGLAAMALLVMNTVIASRNGSALAFAAVLTEATALPVLILYFVWSWCWPWTRLVLVRSVLGAGQVLSVLGLVFFLGSYSLWAMALFLGSAILCFCWLWRYLIPKTRALWPDVPIVSFPALHRTKKDRLYWAMWCALRELGLSPDDCRAAPDLGPADFDGKTLHRCELPSRQLKERFDAIVLRKLREAAATAKRR